MKLALAKKEWYYLGALMLLCVGTLFYGLGDLPLLGPDEPRYVQVAREMFASGDWITPRLGGLPWFEKPALLYWMTAASFKAFGVSELSARLSVALAASATALLLFFFGWRVISVRFGYLSACVLLTSGLWLGFGRAATFDTPLSFSLTLALLAFFWWEHNQLAPGRQGVAGGASVVLWWVFWLALGLAVLAKGLVGIVLPAAIIGSYLIVNKGLGRILQQPWLLVFGMLLFLATVAIWYGPMVARHGREFIEEFFIGHHFQRFFSNKYRHPQPFYFFFVIALIGCFPWSLYLAVGAWRAARQWRRLSIPPPDRLKLYLWLWVLLPVIFFSFSESKLPGYILPIFPAVAMIIARELEGWWQTEPPGRLKWLATATALLLIIVAIGVGWRGSSELNVSASASWMTAGAAITVAIVYLSLLKWCGGKIALFFLPFGLTTVVIATTHLLFPGLGTMESMRELSQLAARAARPGERLAFYLNNEQSINYYAPELPLRDARAGLITATSPAEIAALIELQPDATLLVISLQRWSPYLIYDDRMEAELLAEQKRGGEERNLVLMRVWLR